jgi:DNA-binding transcriptional ArsR family regulator
MTKPLEDIDARAAGALTHPLRMAILWALEDGPASPSELARRIEAPLEAVSYHVRKLHQLRIIEADEPEVLEGNVRHPYRLTTWPRIDEDTWDALPPRARDALAYAVLRRVWRTATASFAAGGFRRPDAMAFRIPMALDEQGFKEAYAVLVQAEAGLGDVERRAAERLGAAAEPRDDATAVLLLFETPTEEDRAGALGDLYAYRASLDRPRRREADQQ